MKPIVIIYKESLAKSLISDIGTFGFLLLCIWASWGSTWWTFLTGTMFLVAMCIKLAAATHSDSVLRFYSIHEVRKWAEKQEKS